jgi:hypothetical protein
MTETGALCVLAPVSAGREAAVLVELAALPAGDHSPFARIPEVHFARFSLAPFLVGRRGKPLPSSAQVVFASEFDGDVGDYIESVRTRMPDEVQAILGNCVGFQGLDRDRFQRWLLRHSVRPGFSYRAYSGTSVAEIRTSLHLHERLAGFSVRARGLSPADVRRTWLETFGDGAE